jgi:hypothetical protein
MSMLDFIKALGVALLLMAANVAVAFAVVWAYSAFIAPGHEAAFYQAAAQRIAPWSSIVAGIALFFAAGWLFAKRKPARNGMAFAATFTAVYAALDLSMVIAEGVVAALWAFVVASMLSKLVAALAGAALARRAA